MEILLLIIFAGGIFAFKHWMFNVKRKQRRDYYRNDYLQSDAWKRKRYFSDNGVSCKNQKNVHFFFKARK
jgi:hypothetical protein